MKASFIPKIVGIIALFGTLIGFADSTAARRNNLTVQICNYTDDTLYGAIGYYDGSRKISEGWYPIRPDRCTTLGEEIDSPIYLYAQTEDGEERWIPREGYSSRRFCTGYEVDEDYYFRGNDCDEEDGRERWFGRVVDRNDDGYALFNIYED